MPRGRPPSARTLVDRQLGRNIPRPMIPAEDTFVVPNHSGDHSAGTTGTPNADLDIANKKYVDDNAGLWETNTDSAALKVSDTIRADDDIHVVDEKKVKWGFKITDGSSDGEINAPSDGVLDINAGVTLNLKIFDTDEMVLTGSLLDVKTKKISNVTNPTSDQDAATKKYVDDNIPTVPNPMPQSLYLETPSDADDLPIFYTDRAITITKVIGTTPVGTVTLMLKWRAIATRFTGGTNIQSANLVADSNGQETTSFSDATIPADSVISYTSSATGSTPPKVMIDVEYTID